MSLGGWRRALFPQEDGEGPLYLQSSAVLLSWKWRLGESLSIIGNLWKMMAHLWLLPVAGNMWAALSSWVGALLWVICNLKSSSDLPFGTYSSATASLLCPYYRAAHPTSRTTGIISHFPYPFTKQTGFFPDDFQAMQEPSKSLNRLILVPSLPKFVLAFYYSLGKCGVHLQEWSNPQIPNGQVEFRKIENTLGE